MKKRKIFLLFSLLAISVAIFLSQPLDLTAQASTKTSQSPKEGSDDKGPEILMHDYGDITEDLLKYWGNVEFVWDKYHFYADYVEYNPKTKMVTAKGRVTMASEETVVSGEQLTLNLADGTGEMYDVYGQMSPTVRYNAENWKRKDKNTYIFKKFQFTSCAQCTPRWKITCSKGKIKKEKYIAMNNVVIKIKKVPVLYLPYLSYPIKDKSTGFLFPKPGNHYLSGFTFKNAFYWDIKPNIDMTLYLDYFSKAGWGAAEEFRYLFKNVEGNLKFYYLKYNMSFDETLGMTTNILGKDSTYDYYVNFKHIHSIDFLNTKIVVDVDNQSDPSFLRLFDNNFDRSLSNRYYSSFFIRSSFLSNLNMTISARKNVTYYTIVGKEASNILEYMPSISLTLNQQKFWKIPGYFSIDSVYERVTRSGVSYEEGSELYQDDFTSQRINLTPSYTLNLFSLPWLSTTVAFRSQHSFYFKSKDPVTKEIVDEPLHLNYNMVTANMKGPTFFKIYETKKSKIKHVIEPEINFRYSSQMDEELIDRLARVDFSDRPPYSYVGFGLTTRLLKKSKDKGDKSSPREIFSYTISQNYYFDPVEANFYRKIDGEYPEFSELGNQLRLRFVEDFSLDISLSYNYYIKGFDRVGVLLSFNKENSILNGSVAYTVYRNPYKVNFFQNKTYLRGDLDLDIPRFPIKLKAGIDYDMTDKVFRYGALIASLDYQCINFLAEFRLYTRMDGEVDYQYNFGIAFGNVGIVRDFLESQR